MTASVPPNWVGLVLIVFVLGLQHGIDPDHIATIDGLVRFNARNRPRLARWSGCLFSLGHGFVVTVVAGLVAALTTDWSPPAWVEHLGAWISILFLIALGAANLAAVFRTPPGQVVPAMGLKGRWLGRFSESSHPVVIASIGAAFALSFDTLSQAALFSITALHVIGWTFSVALGLVFTSGMMVADGVNGLWVARLLHSADRRALIASRVMGLSIAFLSFSIAALGMARCFATKVSLMTEGTGPLMGVGVMIVLLASFAVAMRVSRPA